MISTFIHLCLVLVLVYLTSPGLREEVQTRLQSHESPWQRDLLISYIWIDKTSHNKLTEKQVRQKLDTEEEEQYKHT